MNWRCFRITFELLGPLHIGFYKVGSVQRTRHYIPARNLLAASAEIFVRTGLFRCSYQDSLRWVQERLAFSYFFVDEGRELIPSYTDEGLKYGDLGKRCFERRYISAHVTTAIEASVGSAEDGSLHEVEFIAPHTLDNSHKPTRTRMSGYIFVRDDAWETMGDETALKNRLTELQVGGERRYGFGRLRLRPADWTPSESICGLSLTLDASRPRIKVAEGCCFLAHVPASGVQARGMIEPLVGRETQTDSRTYGRTLTRSGICWVPGSICEGTATFDFSEEGIWKKAH
ncbi:MAG: hypothetical protein ABSG32_18350 [Terriglobia bacterium]|jgi:hypothetical protein